MDYQPQTCQNCGAQARPQANFCQACGSSLGLRCPACQQPVTPHSRFCASCGANLVNPTAANPGAAPFGPGGYTPPAPTMFACPRCDSVNDPGATFCYSCGLPLEEGVRTPLRIHPGIDAYVIAAPGGFWIRSLAYLIDGILLFVAFSLLWGLASGETPADYWESSEFRDADFYSFVVDALYYTIGVGVWATTAGKKTLGLRVVRRDGSKVGLGRALARYLAYFLSAMIFFIGFLMIGVRRDKRGLHDLICDTVVIRG